MKIVFFGTDTFAVKVLDAVYGEHEVVGIVTTQDAEIGRKQILQASPVAMVAENLGLPLFKPASLRDPSVVNTLASLAADVFVVVVYGKIIPSSILFLPQYKSVNVHPSVLPKYRGPSPIRTPILNGDTKTGVSIMIMDEQVDHGPLLAAKEVIIASDDTNVSLTKKLAEAAAPLLVDTLNAYVRGNIVPKEQNHVEATYTKMVSRESGRVDWAKTAAEIYNAFRAFYDWPGIWTTWEGQMLKIIDCVPENETTDKSPGVILDNGKVASGNGTVLKINQLQLAGKNVVDIKSFLNGYKNFTGQVLK